MLGRMTRRHAPLVAALASTLAACYDGPPLPAGAVRMEAPAVYALWWEQVRACSRRDADLGRIRFYDVPGGITIEGRSLAGYFDARNRRIVLARDWALHPRVVRHEMLHAFVPLQEHPREYFLHRCGDVVSCDGDCRTEAGVPNPRTGVARVPATALEVDVAVEPDAPSGTVLGGWFSVVITAHNPLPHDVVVTLPPSGDAGPPVSFSYWLVGELGMTWYNGRIYDAGASYFRAGETKRAIHDFRIGSTGDYRARPGTFTLRGAFGPQASADRQVTIAP